MGAGEGGLIGYRRIVLVGIFCMITFLCNVAENKIRMLCNVSAL